MSTRRARRRLNPGSRLLPAGIAITGVAFLAAGVAPEATGARAAAVHTAAVHTTTVRAAAAGTTTCTGSQTVTYSPGLSAGPREITVHGVSTLNHCVSSADPRITAARSTFHATGRLSCTSGTYAGTREINWNNGRTSTLSFHSAVSVNAAGNSVVAIRGEVTKGQFGGRRWSAAFTMFAARPHACATREGLPTASGPLLLGVGTLVPGAKMW